MNEVRMYRVVVETEQGSFGFPNAEWNRTLRGRLQVRDALTREVIGEFEKGAWLSAHRSAA